MTRRLAAFGMLVALLLGMIAFVPRDSTATGPEIGSVTRLQSSAIAQRDGGMVTLAKGSSVYRGDRIETGDDARIEVTLSDGTALTMGAKARLRLDDFVFDPDSSTAGLTIDALEGSFRFVSGRLGSMTNKRVAIATPFGAIGIRGTDFWAGPIRGAYGVLLLDGAVGVTNAGTTRVLDAAGQGVDIEAPDAAPGPVTPWGQGKIDEALAAVAFTQ